jgi:hypothetical protein
MVVAAEVLASVNNIRQVDKNCKTCLISLRGWGRVSAVGGAVTASSVGEGVIAVV